MYRWTDCFLDLLSSKWFLVVIAGVLLWFWHGFSWNSFHSKFQFNWEFEGHGFISWRLLFVTLVKQKFIYLFIYFIYLFILILHSSVWKLFLIGNYPLQDCRGKCHLSKSKIYCPGQSDLSYFLPWANSPRTLRANRAYSATTGFCFQFSTVITGVTEVMPLYDSPDLSAYILSLV